MPSSDRAKPKTLLPRLPYPVPADDARGATMSAIRSADTGPEVAVRAALHRLGYRFRKGYKVRAAGRKRSVDIAFPTEGLIVFVDGCYWHQCPEHGTTPKTNTGYWGPKLQRTVARDALVTESLKRDGWAVLRIWEHTPPADGALLIAEEIERLRSLAAARREAAPRSAVDLFAGAGGSTEGLKTAGYTVVAAVEFDEACCQTYRSNHDGGRLFEEDIKGLKPRRLRKSIGLAPGELGLLNACPPCQGFSSLGAGDEDDDRNDLVSTVWEFIDELQPQAFLLENVPGLERDRRLKGLLSSARESGYAVKTFLVNAKEFGVPQSRRRVIAHGIRGGDESKFPAHPAELLPRSFRRQPDPISDVLAKAGPIETTKDEVHRARSSTPEVAERIKLIPVNGSRFDLPESHQLNCHKSLSAKRSAAASYGRLRLDEPAPTLTTRCTTPACGRFVHPTEHRGISLREAALIQTFPRKYRFKGSHQSIEAQVGNAVPVRMAQALAISADELFLRSSLG